MGCRVTQDLMSWVILSRPGHAGTGLAGNVPPAVWGYFQPELSKLADEGPSGRRNLLNALKRARANENQVVAFVLALSIHLYPCQGAVVEADRQSQRTMVPAPPQTGHLSSPLQRSR